MMEKIILILSFSSFLNLSVNCYAQDRLSFKGQLSTWMLYNGGNELPVLFGSRYLPQLNSDLLLKNDQKIPDFIFSKAALKQ